MTQYRFTLDLPPHLQREFDAWHTYLCTRLGSHVSGSQVARYVFTGALEGMARQTIQSENSVIPAVSIPPQPEDTTSVPVVDAPEKPTPPEKSTPPEKPTPPSDEPYKALWTTPVPGRTFRLLDYFDSVDGFAISPGQKAALDRVDSFYKGLGWEKWEVYIDDVPPKFRRNVVYWSRLPALQEFMDEQGDVHDVLPPGWSDGAGRHFKTERGEDGTPSNLVITGTDEGVGHSLPYDWGLGATA